jgi:GT2 family glycosyltransferase
MSVTPADIQCDPEDRSLWASDDEIASLRVAVAKVFADKPAGRSYKAFTRFSGARVDVNWISRLVGRIGRRRLTAARRAANAHRDASAWREASDAYRLYLKGRPADGPIWIQLGHVLREAGDLTGADDAYVTAETVVGDEAELKLHRGRLARLRGEEAKATRLFAESYVLSPEGPASAELFDRRGLPHLAAAIAGPGGKDVFPPGRIEQSSRGAAVGWAVDPDAPDRPAIVEFLQGDAVVGTVAADQARPDLTDAGLAFGHGGFKFEYSGLGPHPEHGWTLAARLKSTGAALSGSPFSAAPPASHQAWAARPGRPTSAATGVRLSIIVPVHDPAPEWLAEAIAGVQAQDCPDWELVCVDDGCRDPAVLDLLRDAVADDDRIRCITVAEQGGGPARATNLGLAAAKADWVAFLDHDDRLEPEAVRRVLEAADLGADMVYSDEALTWTDSALIRDITDRPAFSRDYYLSHPYFVHLVAARRAVVQAAGPLDESLRVSSDVDFVLRLIENSRWIAHIPAVLYRWRTHPASLGHAARDAVTDATVSALRRHLARTGEKAMVSPGPVFNTCRIDWPRPPRRTLAIIPTRNRADLLRQCLDSVEATVAAGDLDILVIDHASDQPETIAYLAALDGRARVMRYEGPFNFARMNNLAVERYGQAYDQYLFLNNDIEAREAGWFERLSSLCARPDVGAAGATLLYPDGRIQHAGVVLGLGGFAEHVYKFEPFLLDGARNPGRGCALVATRDVSAVTAACMMVRREVFEAVDGFDEAFAVGFNDTDLCLRIGAAGYKILNDGLAVLVHHESATRRGDGLLRHPEDAARLIERWGVDIEAGDMFFSPLRSSDPANLDEVHLGETFAPRLRRGLAALDAGIAHGSEGTS